MRTMGRQSRPPVLLEGQWWWLVVPAALGFLSMAGLYFGLFE